MSSDLIILVHVPFLIFLFHPLQDNKFRFKLSQHKLSFYTTSKEIQTYHIRVSPIGSGVTHRNTYVISAMFTPRPLLGELCVFHI